MNAPDQVAVTGRLAGPTGGTLEGGAVLSVHYRGGLNRGTNFRWEINGTEGDLVVSAPYGHLQLCPLTVSGVRVGGRELAELPVPEPYHLVPDLPPEHPGYAVAHAYVQLLDDRRTGTRTVPDFDHAVRRHRTLATIEDAARRG
jgi:predicted dehydrogenase